MTKKKRTVITEQSHEIWIIRQVNGEASDRTQSDNSSAISVGSTQSSDFFETGSNSHLPDEPPAVRENADSTGSDYEITES